MYDVIIVGGGVIGLSTARELSLQGRSVMVLDRGEPADTTSRAAAGMIAPQSEAAEPSPFFDFCLASARRYPAWISQLQEESRSNPEFVNSGVLMVASTEEGQERLRRIAEWQSRAGLRVSMVSPEEARASEPQLTLPLTGGAWMPSEAQVTPAKLLEALSASCSARGVEVRRGEEALEIQTSGDRVTGVRTSKGTLSAGKIVIASGVYGPRLIGLNPPIPVTPRKGQILSLALGTPLFRSILRWEHAYLVTRPSGELVVGATNEEAGFDRNLTPSGIGGLLQRALQLSSHLGGMPIREMWTGLRPMAPDGLPLIGEANVEGLLYATGHYRNGILLAPLTAACVAALVDKRPAPVSLESFLPFRFG